MEQTSVLSLGYILSSDKNSVLLLHHNADPSDISYGKYNGYSAFLKTNEDAFTCFKKAAHHYTGLNVLSAQFRGSIHWPHFQRSSLFTQLFLCHSFEGQSWDTNECGVNKWVLVEDLLRGDYPTWEGDRYFLSYVFDQDPRPFHGCMPYDGGVPQGWTFTR